MKKTGGLLAKYTALSLFLLIMFVVPLYYEDAYFNISEAKTHAFIFLALISIPFVLISVFLNFDRKRFFQGDAATFWFFCLGTIGLISCLCSENIKSSFWGYDGWGIGALIIICFGLFAFFLTKFLNYRHNLWLPVMFFNALIFIMGILHSAGTDVLSLHVGIYPRQFYMYISTIGNINWYVGYLCLIVPLITGFYLSCTSRNSEIIYLSVLTLGIANIIFCASDGIFLGIGVCAFFAIPYIFSDKTRTKRICLLLAIYGLEALLISLVPTFEQKTAVMEGISAVVLKLPVAICIAAAGIISYLAFSFLEFKLEKKLQRIVIIIIEAAIAAAAVFFLLDMFLNFSDSWGSRRGMIWRYSMDIFRDFPFFRKLIGIGPGMLKEYYRELSQNFGQAVLVSHSEPLQYLLTTGTIGLLCWCAAWGSTVKSYFDYKLWNKPEIAFFLPLMAYLGQSLVNSPTVTNMGILSVMFACFCINISGFASEGQKTCTILRRKVRL